MRLKADQLTRTALATAPGDANGQLYEHRAYDANGNLATTSMPGSSPDLGPVAADRKTQMSYYDTGQIAATVDKAKPAVRFEYTAEGWQSSRTPDKRSGGADTARAHTWEYFVDGMLAKETIATDALNSAVNTYAYDANNNPTSAKTASGIDDPTKQTPQEVTSSFDSLDRLAKARQKQQKETNWTVSSFGYDVADNLIARTQGREETDAGTELKAGRIESFEYDAADRLTRQLDGGPTPAVADDRRVTTSLTANGWEASQRVEQADGAGAFSTKRLTSSTYLQNGMLASTRTENGAGELLESHAVDYTDGSGAFVNGNPVSDRFRRMGPKADAPCRAAECVTAYSYDPRDRLVKEATTGLATPVEATFALDAAGNIKRESRSGGPQGAYSVDYDYTADQLKTQTFSGSATGAFSFFYDTLGNLSCKTRLGGTAGDCTPAADTTPSASLVESYAYDSDSRMKRFRGFEAQTKTRDSSFTYDAFDRPVEQTEAPAGAPAKTTVSSYIGLGTEVASEERRAGTEATGALQETKSYSYDAFGRRLSLNAKPVGATSKEFEYGEDPHGNVSLLLDAAGKAQASYGYSAYGETDEAQTQERDAQDPTKILDQKSAQTNPLNQYRYSAKRLDPASGTLDMGARRFGPSTAKFLQEDQYKDALEDLDLATDPLTQNRYSLAGGNPVSFIEADGHMPMDSYRGGRRARRPAARNTRPRRQQRSQTPDSYDRADRRTTDREDARQSRSMGSSNTPQRYFKRPVEKCGGSSAADCAAGAAAGGSTVARKKFIEKNAANRNSGDPSRSGPASSKRMDPGLPRGTL